MLNPVAIVFWDICFCLGFLINDVRGAVIGLLVGFVCSLLAQFYSDIKYIFGRG